MNIIRQEKEFFKVHPLESIQEGTAFRLESGDAAYIKTDGRARDELYTVLHLGTGRFYHYPGEKPVVLLEAYVLVKGDKK